MFKIFKKKSEAENLNLLYRKTLKQAFIISKKNRSEGDKKYAEAELIMLKIEAIK